MAKIKYLVLHCTATPEGREITSETIRKWHLSPPPMGRGWSQVGYSGIIHLDGKIEVLVDYNEDDNIDKWEITNGAVGINSVSRHIVYAGGTDSMLRPKDTRTPEQIEAMKKLVFMYIHKYPDIKVAGHNQFAKKACPSFDVPLWLRSIGVPEKNIK